MNSESDRTWLATLILTDERLVSILLFNNVPKPSCSLILLTLDNSCNNADAECSE
jgi:hypothetical protein